MDLNEILAEMARKPDERYLLEWIESHAESLEDARTAIEAYFEAIGEF